MPLQSQRRSQRVNRARTWSRFAALLLAWGLSWAFLADQVRAARSSDDVLMLALARPYTASAYGSPIFFVAQEPPGARIIIPGRKHVEIDLASQHLRAYDGQGRLVIDAPVSTGKPGVDEKGRERTETLPGIHQVFEVKPFKRWSKDPTVKMLDWIGIAPGTEKGIHSLEPVGEFAHYEKWLGQKASHGCIRLSRKDSRRLVKWIEADWKAYPLIVFIYKEPIIPKPLRLETPYRLFLILREGVYLYPMVSDEPAPPVQQSNTASGQAMRSGDFLLYRKEADGWHLVRSSHPAAALQTPGG